MEVELVECTYKRLNAKFKGFSSLFLKQTCSLQAVTERSESVKGKLFQSFEVPGNLQSDKDKNEILSVLIFPSD